MSSPIRIEDEMINLRELNENDASDEYCDWLNDPIVNQYLVTRKITIEELKKYIREKTQNPACRFFGIFENKKNQLIGTIKLEPIDFKKKIAFLGIMIGNKDYWGKGICTTCVKLLVKYSFEQMNINRVELGVFSQNKAAIRCYQKASLKMEKVKQGGFKIGENSYDEIIMAVEKKK